MWHRWVSWLKGAGLATAALLLAPPVLAGGGGGTYHSTSRVVARSGPAPAPSVVAPAVARPVSVVVTIPPQPAKKPVYVNLRGPDGEARRFLVEGGRAAIQYRQLVLRPGQSVTIRWVAAK
jgi:hypothetical protein